MKLLKYLINQVAVKLQDNAFRHIGNWREVGLGEGAAFKY